MLLPDCAHNDPKASLKMKKEWWNNATTKFNYWAMNKNSEYSAEYMLNHLEMHLVKDFEMSKEAAHKHLQTVYPALYGLMNKKKGAKKPRVIED